MCVFTMIGCVCSTLISGRFGYFTSNPADWLAALSGPVWAVIAILTIVVANITTQMTGVYCLSMAVKVFRPAWPYRRIAIGMTLFCILLILWDGVWTYYDLFLAIVSLSASPACGIIFADFFLVRRDKFNLKACFLRDGHREYCYTHGFNGAALLSFLAGVCLYLLIYNPLQGTVNNLFLMHLTPTAASSAFAGLFYALLCRIPGVNRYCVPEKRGTLER